MNQLTTSTSAAASDAAHSTPPAMTRIDPPHVLGSSTQLEAAPHDDADDAQLPSRNVQQQARQIMSHLREQKQQLDRREEEINRQLASYDQEQRKTRLWLNNQQEQIQERAAQLIEREEHFSAQLQLIRQAVESLDTLSVSRAADESVESNVDEAQRIEQFVGRLLHEVEATRAARHDIAAHRQALVDARRRQEQGIVQEREAALSVVRAAHVRLEEHRLSLEKRAEEIDAQTRLIMLRARLPTPQEIDRQHALDAREQQLVERAAQLEGAEQTLLAQQDEVARDRQAWVEERERLDAQLKIERHRLAQWQRDEREQWQERRELLERRSEALDLRQATLQREHEDVTQQHRETLELRLATEELWGQLSASFPAQVLSQTLTQTRQRVAQQFRLEATAIDSQRRQLEQLRQSLLEQNDKLQQQTQELREWVATRQAEVEQQASHLVQREQELDGEQQEYRRQQQRWHDERLHLQQDIRRLTKELRHSTLSA